MSRARQITDFFATNLDLTGETVEVVGSLADADFLDGQDGLYYLDYNNFTNTPAIPNTTDIRNSISASGDINYDSATGVISFTAASAPVTSVNTQTGAVVLDTDDISEGTTNLYYTDTRVQSYLTTNDYATNTDVSTAVSNLVDTAPATLDTLNELAAALDDDPNFATTVTNSIATKLAIADFSSYFDTDFATKTTTDLTEGTNLYYTDARSRAAISVSGDLTYNSTTGVIGFVERTDAEVRELFSAAGDLSYNSTTGEFSVTTYKTADFNTDFATKTTTDLTEGTNLYYTDARARSAISASGDLSYNSTTGVMSYTTPFIPADISDLTDTTNLLERDDLSNNDTDDLSEGATNLYYTDARARTSVSVTQNAASGNGTLSYNNTDGVFTYTPPDLSGYLTSYTETDPIFSASAASGIASSDITNWNTAYSWGDHSTQGYLTSFTETNDLTAAVTWATVPDAYVSQTSVTQHQAALQITQSQITDLDHYDSADFDTDFAAKGASDLSYDSTDAPNMTLTNVKAALDHLDNNKLEKSAMGTSVVLYPTSTSSGVSTYNLIVNSITDPDYDNPAVNIATPEITADDQLVGAVVTEAGILNGNPGHITVHTAGEIRRTSGILGGSAGFYYTVVHRTSGGTETVMGTSTNTPIVTNSDYENFFADALLTNPQTFTATDRLVIKYYATDVTGTPNYEFQYGGATPVTINVPVPVNIVVQDQTAADVETTTTDFSGILSGADTTIQAALDTIDDIDTDDLPEGATNLYYTDDRVQTKLGNVSGHILPDTDVTYDLGSPTNQFRSLYLSDQTIYMGGLELRVDSETNNFSITSVDGETIITEAFATESYTQAYVTQALADAVVDGSIDLTGYATETYVDTSIANLVDTAPAALDTLNELAAALGDDPNFATTVTNQIAALPDSAQVSSIVTTLVDSDYVNARADIPNINNRTIGTITDSAGNATLDLSTGTIFEYTPTADNTTFIFDNPPASGTGYSFDLNVTGALVSSDVYFDIDSASYDSVSFSTTSQETNPMGLEFNNDGTKMYVLGGMTADIYQYSLSTAFDISTASYDSVSFNVLFQSNNPRSVVFNNDGTKMYILHFFGVIYQYSLSTAFDISTASYDSVSFITSFESFLSADLIFNPDGTKMYVLGIPNARVFQYSLSTAFDISTASYDLVSSDFLEDVQSLGFAFNNDGTKLFAAGFGDTNVAQYSLLTPYDVSTLSFDSVSLDVESQDPFPSKIKFDSNGSKMYIMGTNSEAVYQYSTNGYIALPSFTYPASVEWLDAFAPTSPNDGEILSLQFFTTDGGTTYYGSKNGVSTSFVDTHLNTSSASADQALTWNGSDYEWSNVSEKLTSSDIGVSFTASGSISNGDTVVLNSDGTISPVAQTTGPVTLGTPVTIETQRYSYGSAAYDFANQKVVVAYQDSEENYAGTAVVGTVSGTSISFGSPVVFDNAQSIQTTYDSVNQKIVITYRDPLNSGAGTAVVGTVSGTSISFGSPVVFDSGYLGDHHTTFDSANGKIVIGYVDGNNSSRLTAIVGTVSGTSISFGSPVEFSGPGNVNSGIRAMAYDSTSQKVLVGYADTDGLSLGTIRVGTVSGTSISFGSPVTFSTGGTYAMSICHDPVKNKNVIVWGQFANPESGYAVVGTVSGTSISFGNTLDITPVFNRSLSYPQTVYDPVNQKVIVVYSDESNSRRAAIRDLTVNNDSLTAGDISYITTGRSDSLAMVYDTTNNKVVVAYNDDANTDDGRAVVYIPSSSSTNADDFIGIASQDIADTSTGNVSIFGHVNSSLSGLTPGSIYYVSDTGALTTADTGRLAGKALASNSLIITGGI